MLVDRCSLIGDRWSALRGRPPRGSIVGKLDSVIARTRPTARVCSLTPTRAEPRDTTVILDERRLISRFGVHRTHQFDTQPNLPRASHRY